MIVAGSTLIRAELDSGKPCVYPWAAALLQHKPYRLVSVALTNKMARIVWAVLTSGQPYRAMAGARG